jgi:HTH-type transcriptional regulator/antitoxin HipB
MSLKIDISIEMSDITDMNTQTLTSDIGQQIRLLRKRRGLTQAALAERAGMARSKLVLLEQGSGSVAFESYARIAAALDAAFRLEPAQRPAFEELAEHYRE